MELMIRNDLPQSQDLICSLYQLLHILQRGVFLCLSLQLELATLLFVVLTIRVMSNETTLLDIGVTTQTERESRQNSQNLASSHLLFPYFYSR